jgi:formylglycine-generating enzyme required for sulfatase activity
VTVRDFQIGKYEVTQKQWKDVMGSNPSGFKGCDNCPVEQVSWNDVKKFIQKLNEKTGATWRLPTEAEWEYAARGGRQSNGYVYAGGNDPNKVSWNNSNAGSKTHPVGGKASNELGLYDMSGNVYEWCEDWYKPYPGCKGSDYTGSSRVFRGGSWDNYPRYCRVANRLNSAPDYRSDYVGFRLARTN